MYLSLSFGGDYTDAFELKVEFHKAKSLDLGMLIGQEQDHLLGPIAFNFPC